ncbi:MAG: cobS [Caulobacteraceae bacterium]|nr:cobS [Caulobacteraceae bacterium]
MILREGRRLVCAIQFLTRLPTPQVAWSDDLVARSARYFPLVGLLVGSLSALVLLGARQIWPEGLLPALLAVAAGVAITGAFHEDGLADSADGLGGGQTPAQRLAIMKDSRVGTYGVLALGLSLAVKVCALGMIMPPWTAAAVLVCAQAGGRAAAVATMVWTPYAADPGGSKLKPGARGVRPFEAVVAILIGAAPFLWLGPLAGLACVAAGLAFAAVPALAAQRLIGGHTGDVLGAVEQAFELGCILAAAALWSLGGAAA